MYKHLFCIIITFLVSFPVSAGMSSGWGHITRLYINADGTVLRIGFSKPIVNPESCTKEEFYMKELTEKNKLFVSEVIAAFHSGKEVRLWIAGCTSQVFWGGTRPQLYDIEVAK